MDFQSFFDFSFMVSLISAEIFLLSSSSLRIELSNAALASSYPSKVHPLKYIQSESLSSSLSNSSFTICKMLDFPLPQSPKTPIVIGKTDSSLITLINKSACTLNPNKSSDVSLSAHIVFILKIQSYLKYQENISIIVFISFC